MRPRLPERRPSNYPKVTRIQHAALAQAYARIGRTADAQNIAANFSESHKLTTFQTIWS
jgi:hypothetical protein